jgi:DNA-binding IclR family transcriptional regulator
MRTLETVDRALEMLGAFEHEEELTVAALAAALGIHRSSASRLAGTLAQRGFLERAPGSEAFRLGPAISRLGMLAISGRNLVSESRAPMEHLAERTGEAVVLSALDGDEAVAVAQVSGAHLIGMTNWIGLRAPLHASSDGKVFLAFGSAKLGRGRRPALTPRTVTDPEELARERELVRERGWATALSEFEDGLNGVAVPVWNGFERCSAALSVCGPAYRLTTERVQEVAALAQEAAREITARLGPFAEEPREAPHAGASRRPRG